MPIVTGPRVSEDTYERYALERLGEIGYEVLHGPDIAPDGATPLRESYDGVFLDEILNEQAQRLNPDVPRAAIGEAIDQLKQADAIDLVSRNRKVYRWLRDGLKVTFQAGGEERTEFLRLIDFDHPGANRFHAVNQFTVRGRKQPRRPDIVLFVNGVPLVVFELKNPTDANADVWKAWNQIQTYKDDIPQLFETNLACVIADGNEARLGSLTAPREWYLRWRVIEDERDRPDGMMPLEVLIRGLCRRDYLLQYFRDFVLYQQDKLLTKIIAQYHQFHGVRAAVARTLEASRPGGDKKGGVFWHTQGSGKSLSATFYTGILMEHPVMKNPTIVVVTDRNDLDGQLYRTFCQAADLLGEHPEQAESRQALKELLVTEKVEILRNMLHGLDYGDFRENPLPRMRQAMEHIAGQGRARNSGGDDAEDDIRHNRAIKDFVTHATVLAKAQAMTGADERVARLAEEIGFLMGVRALLVKHTGTLHQPDPRGPRTGAKAAPERRRGRRRGRRHPETGRDRPPRHQHPVRRVPGRRTQDARAQPGRRIARTPARRQYPSARQDAHPAGKEIQRTAGSGLEQIPQPLDRNRPGDRRTDRHRPQDA